MFPTELRTPGDDVLGGDALGPLNASSARCRRRARQRNRGRCRPRWPRSGSQVGRRRSRRPPRPAPASGTAPGPECSYRTGRWARPARPPAPTARRCTGEPAPDGRRPGRRRRPPPPCDRRRPPARCGRPRTETARSGRRPRWTSPPWHRSAPHRPRTCRGPTPPPPGWWWRRRRGGGVVVVRGGRLGGRRRWTGAVAERSGPTTIRVDDDGGHGHQRPPPPWCPPAAAGLSVGPAAEPGRCRPGRAGWRPELEHVPHDAATFSAPLVSSSVGVVMPFTTSVGVRRADRSRLSATIFRDRLSHDLTVPSGTASSRAVSATVIPRPSWRSRARAWGPGAGAWPGPTGHGRRACRPWWPSQGPRPATDLGPAPGLDAEVVQNPAGSRPSGFS